MWGNCQAPKFHSNPSRQIWTWMRKNMEKPCFFCSILWLKNPKESLANCAPWWESFNTSPSRQCFEIWHACKDQYCQADKWLKIWCFTGDDHPIQFPAEQAADEESLSTAALQLDGQQLSTLRGEPLREELRLGHFKCHFGTSDGEYQNDSDSVHFVRLLMTIYESTDRDLPHLPLSGLIVGSCWFHIPSSSFHPGRWSWTHCLMSPPKGRAGLAQRWEVC